MEPLGIVDLLDEPGQPLSDVREGLVAGGVDIFHFQRLHEALRLRIVIGLPTALVEPVRPPASSARR